MINTHEVSHLSDAILHYWHRSPGHQPHFSASNLTESDAKVIVGLHNLQSLLCIRRRSSSRTSCHTPGRQTGTKWCRSCKLIWIFPVECRYSPRHSSPPRWSEMFHQRLHQHWEKLLVIISPTQHWTSPIIHQQVWLPDVFGRNSDVSNITIVRRIPLQVYVIPFLDNL